MARSGIGSSVHGRSISASAFLALSPSASAFPALSPSPAILSDLDSSSDDEGGAYRRGGGLAPSELFLSSRCRSAQRGWVRLAGGKWAPVGVEEARGDGGSSNAQARSGGSSASWRALCENVLSGGGGGAEAVGGLADLGDEGGSDREERSDREEGACPQPLRQPHFASPTFGGPPQLGLGGASARSGASPHSAFASESGADRPSDEEEGLFSDEWDPTPDEDGVLSPSERLLQQLVDRSRQRKQQREQVKQRLSRARLPFKQTKMWM